MNITFVPVFFDIRSFFGATPKTTPQLHSSLFLNAFVPFFSAFVPFFLVARKKERMRLASFNLLHKSIQQKKGRMCIRPFFVCIRSIFFCIRSFFLACFKKKNECAFVPFFEGMVCGMCFGDVFGPHSSLFLFLGGPSRHSSFFWDHGFGPRPIFGFGGANLPGVGRLGKASTCWVSKQFFVMKKGYLISFLVHLLAWRSDYMLFELLWK